MVTPTSWPSNEITPEIKRAAFLAAKIVTLVDADNAGERSTGVVQYLLDHRQSNAEPGHAARGGAAKVVQNPVRNAACRIEPGLEFAEPVHYATAKAERIPLAVARQRLNQGNGLRAERNLVSDVVFDPFARQANQSF